jgi:transposase
VSIYVGMDLHSDNVMIGWMDADGKRLKHQRLPNRLDIILDCLNPQKEQIVQIGVEVTYNWYWLVDGLLEAQYPVVLAHAAAMQQYSGLKHTDDVSDAFFVTELMRLKRLPTGHIYDAKLRPYRDLLRRRQLLVHHRTSLLLSVKSLYTRTTGQKLSQGETKALEPETVAEWFDHPADQLIAGEQAKLIQDLNASIHALEKEVEAVADQLPCYHRIQELPGIGRILALTISMETGPIARFVQDGNYVSYCRCVPTERESNGKNKGENNGKCGNKYLAWVPRLRDGSGAFRSALRRALLPVLRAQESQDQHDGGHQVSGGQTLESGLACDDEKRAVRPATDVPVLAQARGEKDRLEFGGEWPASIGVGQRANGLIGSHSSPAKH